MLSQSKPEADVFHPVSDWPDSWTFPMAYFKEKLKSNGNEASPCFKP
jgi:hypothetical protein